MCNVVCAIFVELLFQNRVLLCVHTEPCTEASLTLLYTHLYHRGKHCVHTEPWTEASLTLLHTHLYHRGKLSVHTEPEQFVSDTSAYSLVSPREALCTHWAWIVRLWHFCILTCITEGSLVYTLSLNNSSLTVLHTHLYHRGKLALKDAEVHGICEVLVGVKLLITRGRVNLAMHLPVLAGGGFH